MKLFLSLLLCFSALADFCPAQSTKAVMQILPGNKLVDSLHVSSGGTLTIDSGATIINNGTATGFGTDANPTFDSVTINGDFTSDAGMFFSDGLGNVTFARFASDNGAINSDGVGNLVANTFIGSWAGAAIVVGVGGTGQTTWTQGDMLYANTSSPTTLTPLNKSTSTTRYLANTGINNNPKWDTVNLANGVAGTLANANTTATNANTVSTIVARDASGNFTAGTITAMLTGNSSTATALATGRTISITGDLAYTSPSFTGSGNVTAAGTLATVNGNVGSFTNASVTVNAKGLVTAASNGSAGASPAGSMGQLQINGGSGAFGAVTNFTLTSDGSATITSTPQNAFLTVNPSQVGGADYAISFLAKFGFIDGGTGNFFQINSGAGALLTANSTVFEIPQATTRVDGLLKVIGAISATSGTNVKAGNFTLASGVATVGNTSVTTHSVIHASPKAGSVSGTIAPICFPTVTAGTGFTVLGGTLDNSVYNYWIEENN